MINSYNLSNFKNLFTFHFNIYLSVYTDHDSEVYDQVRVVADIMNRN